jgi:hypothetical protein
VPRKHEPVAYHYNRASRAGYTIIAGISVGLFLEKSVRAYRNRERRIPAGINPAARPRLVKVRQGNLGKNLSLVLAISKKAVRIAGGKANRGHLSHGGEQNGSADRPSKSRREF